MSEKITPDVKATTLKTQPKWKSRYFWAAIVSVILFVLGNWGLYDKVGLTSETAQTLVNLVFGAIAALGVWNDSSDAANF